MCYPSWELHDTAAVTVDSKARAHPLPLAVAAAVRAFRVLGVDQHMEVVWALAEGSIDVTWAKGRLPGWTFPYINHVRCRND